MKRMPGRNRGGRVVGTARGRNRASVGTSWSELEKQVVRENHRRGPEWIASHLSENGFIRRPKSVLDLMNRIGLFERSCPLCGRNWTDAGKVAKTICPHCGWIHGTEPRVCECGAEFYPLKHNQRRCPACIARLTNDGRRLAELHELHDGGWNLDECPWAAGRIWGAAAGADPVLGF
jgi:hypothetical protein